MHKGMQVVILAALLVFWIELWPANPSVDFAQGCAQGKGAAHMLCGGKFSFSSATARDFLVLPGVGPTMAEHLLRAQNSSQSWRRLDRRVKGLGPKKLAMLKQFARLP